MLELNNENMTAAELDLDAVGLVRLSHQSLAKSLRQVNGRMTRELLNSPDTLRVLDMDDAPVPINPRRFIELMAPYLCMN